MLHLMKAEPFFVWTVEYSSTQAHFISLRNPKAKAAVTAGCSFTTGILCMKIHMGSSALQTCHFQ